jgi:hypothetical protein
VEGFVILAVSESTAARVASMARTLAQPLACSFLDGRVIPTGADSAGPSVPPWTRLYAPRRRVFTSMATTFPPRAWRRASISRASCTTRSKRPAADASPNALASVTSTTSSVAPGGTSRSKVRSNGAPFSGLPAPFGALSRSPSPRSPDETPSTRAARSLSNPALSVVAPHGRSRAGEGRKFERRPSRRERREDGGGESRPTRRRGEARKGRAVRYRAPVRRLAGPFFRAPG